MSDNPEFSQVVSQAEGALLEALDADGLDVVRDARRRRPRGRNRTEGEVRARRRHRPVLAVQGGLDHDIPLHNDRTARALAHDSLAVIDENVAGIIDHPEVDYRRIRELSRFTGCWQIVHGADGHVYLHILRPPPLEDDLIRIDVRHLAEAVGGHDGG